MRQLNSVTIPPSGFLSRRLLIIALSLLLVQGCGYPFDPQDGTVFIQVRTVADEPVQGVQAALIGDEGQIMNGLEGQSDAQGEIRWGGAPVGEWRIDLQLPSGYSLAPGQVNPIPVRVRDDKETRVQITLSDSA